jgi:hypothetical protein
VQHRPGGPPQTPPGQQTFWAVSDSGPDATVTWDIAEGSWVAVVMNEDGSRIVAADLTFGARVGWLIWIAIGALIAGLLVLAAGRRDDLLRRARSAGDGDRRPAAPITAPWTTIPCQLDGALDAHLSRFLWLVKWLLAIPHYLVLASCGSRSPC